jgi:hypothetical protein
MSTKSDATIETWVYGMYSSLLPTGGLIRLSGAVSTRQVQKYTARIAYNRLDYYG